MQHRGEIVENRVRHGKISISDVSKKLGISRNTLYSKFKEEKLSLDFIRDIGKVIGYDFGADFNELSKSENSTNITFLIPDESDPSVDYKVEFQKAVNENKVLLNKHFEITEKYTELLEEQARIFAEARDPRSLEVEIQHLKDKLLHLSEKYIKLLEILKTDADQQPVH